jgi:hypothetical protein
MQREYATVAAALLAVAAGLAAGGIYILAGR